MYFTGVPYRTVTYTGTPVYVPFTFLATATPKPASSKGAIIGGAVGSIVFIFAVFGLLFFFCGRRNVDPIVTIEDDKARRPALDDPVVGSPLPQVPYPPSFSRQSLAESRTPGPSEVPSNPYNVSGTDAGSQIAAKPSEKSSKLMSFPDPTRMSGTVESQSMQTVPGSSSTSPMVSVLQTEPDRSSTTAAGDRPDLRPELEALKAQVAQLQQMVVPDVAPPQYDG
jgi:hypothetical protein